MITFSGTPGSTSDLFTVSGDHTYGEEGKYKTTVTISHEKAPSTIVNGLATVSDPAVLATGDFVIQAVRGAPFCDATAATFTDPGGAEPNIYDDNGGLLSKHYSASIDWGDGTAASAGAITFAGTAGSKTDSFTVAGDHVYSTNGNYIITVTIDHESIITTTTSKAVVQSILNHAKGCCDDNSLVMGASLTGDVIRIAPVGQQTGGLTDKVEVFFNDISQGTFDGFNKIAIFGQDGADDLGIAGSVKKDACVFAGKNNDRIKGGGSNNILVGGDGNDTICADNSSGFGILIGGNGSDRIVGNGAGDLLIAGYTDYDDPRNCDNTEALCQLRDAWAANVGYDIRSANLIALLAGLVHDDTGASDVLTGSSGQDLFFISAADAITGKQKGETIVAV